MSPSPSPPRKNDPAFSRYALLAVFWGLIAIVGCRLFGGGGGIPQTGSLESTDPTVIRTFSTTQAEDFQTGAFRIRLPAGCFETNRDASILLHPIPFLAGGVPPGWTAITDGFELRVPEGDSLLVKPARIDFALPAGILPESGSEIRIALKTLSGGWFLLGPPLEPGRFSISLDSFRTGTWVLVRSNPGNDTIKGFQGPSFFASPSLMIPSTSGLFAQDLFLTGGFKAPLGGSSDPARNSFDLVLRSHPSFPVAVFDPAGSSSTRNLAITGGSSEKISLLRSSCVDIAREGPGASGTVGLPFAGKTPAQCPGKIYWTLTLSHDGGPTFLLEGMLSVASQTAVPAHPRVVTASPTSSVSPIPPFENIVIFFSQPMARPSVENALVITPSPTTPSSFTWNDDSTVFSFRPGGCWNSSQAYLIEIGTGASDLSGLHLEHPFRMTFTTADDPGPSILETDPLAERLLDVPLKAVIFRFDREMDTGSVLGALAISPPAFSAFNHSWTNDDRDLHISWNDPIPGGITITASFSVSARDSRGRSLTGKTLFLFHPPSNPHSDTTPPSVTSMSPGEGSINVPNNSAVSIAFSEAMDQLSVATGITLVLPGPASHSFQWSPTGDFLTIVPDPAWPAPARITVEIGTGCADLAGNRLTKARSLSFSTIAQSGPTIISTTPPSGTIITASTSAIAFVFDRTMDPTSVRKALGVAPSSLGAPIFTWESAFRVLHLSWPSTFPENSLIVASFSALARDSGGLPIGGITFFRFPTGDWTPPRIVSHYPASGASKVPLNTSIAFTFSEPMNKAAVQACITASPPLLFPNWTWNEAGNFLTVTRPDNWPVLSECWVRVSSEAADLSGLSLGVPTLFSFITRNQPAPVLSETSPKADSTGVPRNSPIRLDFSLPMNVKSVENSLGISPTPPGEPSFSWNASETSLSISFSALLGNFTSYTVWVGSDSLSLLGTHLTGVSTFRFRTADSLPPALIRTYPEDGSSGFPPSASLTLEFDEPIDHSSLEIPVSLTPAPPGTPRGRWLQEGNLFEVSWSPPLAESTRYSCRIDPSVRDFAGNPLSGGLEFLFDTADVSPPAISAVSPASGAVSVPRNTTIEIDFSESVDPDSVSVSVFPAPDGVVSRTWSGNGSRLSMGFPGNLSAGTLYLVELSSGISDASGNRTTRSFAYAFTTGAKAAPRIVSSNPFDGTTEVPPFQTIQLIFDREMDPGSVEKGIALSPAPPSLPAFSWDGSSTTVSLTFALPLALGTTYRVFVASSVRALDGVEMGIPVSFAFTTRIPPSVVASQVFPGIGSSGIATNSTVSVQFTREMDRDASQDAFSLLQAGSRVSGDFSWSGATMTFSPAGFLRPGTSYSVEIGKSACDITGIPISNAFSWSFQTASDDAPMVSSTSPKADETGVSLESELEFRFSASISPETLEMTIVPSPGPGFTISWADSGRVLKFHPAIVWVQDTWYSVTFGTGTRDLFGTQLVGSLSFRFRTEARPNPVVTLVSPTNGATEIMGSQTISLTFSKSMDSASVEAAFSLVPQPPASPTFVWKNSGQTLEAAFPGNLGFGTEYLIKIGTGARDSSGFSLVSTFTSLFTTIPRPEVLFFSCSPASGATDISTGTSIRLAFSREMEPLNLESGVTVSNDSGPLAGSWNWPSPNSPVFTPVNPLPYGKKHLVRISGSSRDILGIPLGADTTFSFTTISLLPPTVDSTLPVDGDPMVPFGNLVSVNFSKSMATETVLIGIAPTPSGITGRSWSNGNRTLILAPEGGWDGSTTYRITLGSTSSDLLGMHLGADFSFSFTTRAKIPPRVISVSPPDQASDQEISSPVEVSFDKVMNTTSVESAFSLAPNPGSAVFSWPSPQLLRVTFHPLPFGTRHSIAISTGARDIEGLSIGERFESAFFTEYPPYVVPGSEFPSDHSVGAATTTVTRVSFSKAMDGDSVRKAFGLWTGEDPVPGTIQWSGFTLLFTPTLPLAGSASFTLRIASTAADLHGNPIPEPFESVFSTAANPSFRILACEPASGGTGIPLDTSLEVFFSSAVATSTLAFEVSPPFPGAPSTTWSEGNRHLSIVSPAQLDAGTTYRFRIGPATRDSAGIPLQDAGTFSFTTVTISAPVVLSISPTDKSSDIGTGTTVSLTFDQGMATASVETAFAISPVPSGGKGFSWNAGNNLLSVFFPGSLAFDASHSIVIATSARSMAGTALAQEFRSEFHTLAAPKIIQGSEVPAREAAGVATSTKVGMVFSRPMDPTSTEAAFSLRSGPDPISGTFSWAGSQMTFTPTLPLPGSSTVSVNVATTARDVLGNALSPNTGWSFSTVPNPLFQVVQMIPEPGSVSVPLDQHLEIVFSNPVSTPTLDFSIIPPHPGTTSLAWSDANRRLSLLSDRSWGNGTGYLLKIGTATHDVFGSQIPSPFVATFTTTLIPPPGVISVLPTPETVDVPCDSQVILGFGQAMDPLATLEALTVTPVPAGSPTFSWSGDGTLLTVSFPLPLPFDQRIEVLLASSAANTFGIPMVTPFQFGFRTIARPTILPGSAVPSSGAVDIATNTVFQLVFSREMDKDSVLAAFSLIASGVQKAGSISWSGATMTFTPASPLPYGASVTVVIGGTAHDLLGNPMGTNSIFSFRTVPPPPFALLDVFPASGSLEVSVITALSVTFNNPVATGTFGLLVSPAPLGSPTITWSPDNRTATVTYGIGFESGRKYFSTISSGTLDQNGLGLGSDREFSFTCQTISPPRVISVTPVAGSLEVPRSTPIRFDFDQPMAASVTEDAFQLIPPAAASPTFGWASGGTRLEATFGTPLEYAQVYSARISSGARNLFGVNLSQDFQTGFKTETRPTLVSGSENPARGAVNVGTLTPIVFSFSKDMDQTSVEGAFSLLENGVERTGSFSWTSRTLSFQSSSPLLASTTYTVRITTAARDTSGNSLAAPVSWTFSTVTLEGTVWQEDIPSSPTGSQFTQRVGHTLTAFSGKLWLIGGNDGGLLNDVWSSPDGKTWTQVLSDNPTPGTTRFSQRAGHACSVFGGKLWLTGGEVASTTGTDFIDDVWSTLDGTTWVRENSSAAFWARGYHCMMVFEGNLWMFAGKTIAQDGGEVYLQDAWTSSDGVTWLERARTSVYPPRFKAACGTIAGKMWIWGGYGETESGALGNLNDVWYSTNGDLWLRSTANASFTPRCGMGFVIFRDKLWFFGGSGVDSFGWDAFLNDVWNTGDGINWFRILPDETPTTIHFQRRTSAPAAVLDGRVFIAGGEDSATPMNDVWSAE